MNMWGSHSPGVYHNKRLMRCVSLPFCILLIALLFQCIGVARVIATHLYVFIRVL